MKMYIRLRIKKCYHFLLMLFYNTICKTKICFFNRKDTRELKYTLSLCLIFKDEAPFLKEWLDYHITVGVDHFYLYNNNSIDNFREVLEHYIISGIVTLIEWPKEYSQMEAYEHCYTNYRGETNWMSFLDADEFICPKYALTIPEWLEKFAKYPAVVIGWKMFGTGGLLEHDYSKGVIEQYFSCMDEFYKHGKCIINTRFDIANLGTSSLHHHTLTWFNLCGFNIKLPAVDQCFNFGLFEHPWAKIPYDKSTIAINHYYTKSWGNVVEKIKKTDVYFRDSQIARGNIDFTLEKELQMTIKDYTIMRFFIKMKLMHGVL